MSRFSFLRSDRQEAASGKRSSIKKDAADPALPEKKRARRRLVGAVTLTLSAIIVLPMVLDPDPKPVSQDMVIDISSKNKSTQALIKEQDPVRSATPATVAPGVEPAVQAAPVVAATAVAATDKSRAATPESAKPPVKPSDSSTKQVKTTSERKTIANAESRAGEANTAANQQGKLMIQVAALATQKGVNELQAKLKSAGIKSHTQKVATQSGERIRVRIGPLANKGEADGICAKLVKIRLQCTLIGT